MRALTTEQQIIVDSVKEGKNILVDACIGSGKTSVLEEIYKQNKTKDILYLTFNTLLKLEAKSRLPKRKGSLVTNYHGFVYPYLMRVHEKTSISESLKKFVEVYNKGKILLNHWDILLIDEYQDINEEMANVLECVKKQNPNIQIIAVGDMAQKIYNHTRLNVLKWIMQFLDEHILLGLTKCFRISKDLAAMLGRVWNKEIHGINEDCKVLNIYFDEALEIALQCEPSKMICLGGNTNSNRSTFQNELEGRIPEKFNKNTLYSAIRDEDKGDSKRDTSKAAVFTTFDASKGMERDFCFVFDFTYKYWKERARLSKKYEILRNIFCVAASRGKKAIYFVRDKNIGKNDPEVIISERILKTEFKPKGVNKEINISTMFEFKYKELIDECYTCLKTEELPKVDGTTIEVINYDGYIDLNPCIGIYQEVMYFTNHNYAITWKNLRDNAIKFYLSEEMFADDITLKRRVLAATAVETAQLRYVEQVEVDFMSAESEDRLINRISTAIPRNATIQVGCKINFEEFIAVGYCDVKHNEIIYELKFVSELSHEHFLQCACYMVALDMDKGILWNTRDNTMYLVHIPCVETFKEHVKKVVIEG